MHRDAIFAWGKRYGILTLILLVAVLVRTYKFGSVPAGMHQDEASLAYDAWSLLKFGVERNGFRFPIMLAAYGCGMSGTLAAYLMMPFIQLFGLVPFATRMVNLIGGLAAIPLLYLLAKRVWNKDVALLSAFLLAISPWHIMQSRWGLDCNLFPPLFLLATYFLVRSREDPRFVAAALAVYGLSLYSYATSYFVVPLFLLGSALYLLYHQKAHKLKAPWLLLGFALFGIFALPIALFLLINRFDLPTIETPLFSIPNLPGIPRYAVATVIGGAPHPILQVVHNAEKLLALLVFQRDGWIDSTLKGLGILYLQTMPLVVLGVIVSLPKRKHLRRYHPAFFILLWTIVALLLGTILDPVVHRINILYFPLIMLAAVGLASLKRLPVLFVILLVFYGLSFVRFTQVYFGIYPPVIAMAFEETFDEAIRDAATTVDGPICVTSSIVMPDIRVLHALQLPPDVFSSSVVYENPDGVYRTAKSFDRYRFGLHNCDPQTEAYLIRPTEISKVPTVQTRRAYGTLLLLIK